MLLSSHLLSQSTLPLIIANQSSSPNNEKEESLPLPFGANPPPVTIQRKWRPPSSSLSVVTRFLLRARCSRTRGSREHCYLREVVQKTKRRWRAWRALSLSDNAAGHNRCTAINNSIPYFLARADPRPSLQGNTLLVNAVWIQHAWIRPALFSLLGRDPPSWGS